MQLEELSFTGFRNLADARTELSPGTTVLVGDNGHGKTSFLEAIGFLATTKSFRRAKPAELAQHGRTSFAVSGRVELTGGKVDLRAVFEDGRRTTSVAGLPSELADYIQHLTVVPITEAHAGIIRGGPDERRAFLDRGILGTRPAYLRTLSSYRRTLRQKNALLRTPSPGRALDVQLSAWNDRLAQDGAELVVRRREYVALLSRQLGEVGATFLPPGEELELARRDVVARAPALDGAGAAGSLARTAVADALRRRLDAQAARELAARQALVGPHRDDLAITLGGREARRFASSGQQRNALLAMKVAKVEVFRASRGQSPILLVDDVDTEIDPTRLATFLAHVGGRAQAILTSSKRDLFAGAQGDATFHVVRNGVLTRA